MSSKFHRREKTMSNDMQGWEIEAQKQDQDMEDDARLVDAVVDELHGKHGAIRAELHSKRGEPENA